jgi:hypothetical protein
MPKIEHLINEDYADFVLSIKERLNEKAIEEYETEKVRIGLNLFEAYESDEDEEEINELSKKTLGNYIKRASDKGMTSAFFKDLPTASKRLKGIKKATDRLTNESEDKTLIRIYMAGSAAARSGKRHDDNPYNLKTQNHEAQEWHRGFLDGKTYGNHFKD